MINYFTFIICGSYRITLPVKYRESAVNHLLKNKIRYKNLTNNGIEFGFDILSFSKKRLTESFREKAIPFSESKIKGAPKLLLKYRNRYGIFIGIIIFFIAVFLSQNYVWYMDVKGCKNVSPESVLENLEQLGFTYGTNYKKTDFDYLRHNYLKINDDLCWISVNMQGTYAHVEVRELSDPPDKLNSGCSNIIASESGQIVIVECYEGSPAVSSGDYVTSGDLLISGLMTSGEDSLRYERADGRVLAQVERKFKVIIPKTKLNKTYTEEQKRDVELIFFKKTVKVFGNCRISYAEYDTIINKQQLNLFGYIDLPLFVNLKTYVPYSSESIELSETEISEMKKKLISKRTAEAASDAELIAVETVEFEKENELIVIGTVTCVADIGESIEVDIQN